MSKVLLASTPVGGKKQEQRREMLGCDTVLRDSLLIPWGVLRQEYLCRVEVSKWAGAEKRKKKKKHKTRSLIE